MDTQRISEITTSPFEKGLPAGWESMVVADIGKQGLSLFDETLPMPCAVLKQSALDHNSRWMRSFLAASGASIAPHGKTTLSPQLFRRQLDDGAWGITLSNIHQVKMARHFGVDRIMFANQLVGKAGIDYVLDEIAADPSFDFYCLVDSVENVEALAAAARLRNAGRPLQVLVEGGVVNRRTGCRSLDDAMRVARAVAGHKPYLSLRGVEGFEGVISNPDPAETAASVRRFLSFLVDIALACAQEGLLADEEIILSAGGSAYFDLVAGAFGSAGLHRPFRVVIRSGCYLTHDSNMYCKLADQLMQRSEIARSLHEPLRPALEVWSYLQSRPEPGLGIVTLGKRDATHDAGLPVPFAWLRPGANLLVTPLGEGYEAIEMNDQHLFLRMPVDSPVAIGDFVGFGISHPCLTFDKWRVISVVDDDYKVVSAISTCF